MKRTKLKLNVTKELSTIPLQVWLPDLKEKMERIVTQLKDLTVDSKSSLRPYYHR